MRELPGDLVYETRTGLADLNLAKLLVQREGVSLLTSFFLGIENSTPRASRSECDVSTERGQSASVPSILLHRRIIHPSRDILFPPSISYLAAEKFSHDKKK